MYFMVFSLFHQRVTGFMMLREIRPIFSPAQLLSFRDLVDHEEENRAADSE
jgi:hypothetical protein